VWSGGNGTFDPSTTNMSAIYTPTAAEIANGSVTLDADHHRQRQLCNAATDQMVILFTDSPTANAGPNVTVCANNAVVALNGSVQVATGGIWSGGTGSFSPNASTLNATYTPGAADIAAGQVTLTSDDDGQWQLHARHQHAHHHLHARADRERWNQRDGLRQREQHRPQRLGDRCSGRRVERRQRNLHARTTSR
jgi:hypothetical protein